MDLDDFIIPELPKFKLKKTGKEYELDLVRVHHLSYFKTVVGGGFDKLQEFLSSMPIDEAAKLIYKLMLDKSDFMGSEQEVIDDDGFKVKRRVTGPEKLAATIALDEIKPVIGALMRSVELSFPKAGELIRSMLENAKKKTPPSPQEVSSLTGPSSTTSSPASTVLQ